MNDAQLNIQVTSSDVVTLLVNDQIINIQTEIDNLNTEIEVLAKQEDGLIRELVQEQINIVKSKYEEQVKTLILALAPFHKEKLIPYYTDWDELANNNNQLKLHCWIYEKILWESDRGSNKPIGLRPLQKKFESKITLNILDEERLDLVYAFEVTNLSYSKKFITAYKELCKVYCNILEVADRRNELNNLIKDKNVIKEKAIAEMTRRLLSRNQDLQNDVQEIFNSMSQTKLLVG